MGCSLSGAQVILVCATGMTARVLLLNLAQSLKSAGARVRYAFRFDGKYEQELTALGFECINIPFSRSLFNPCSHIRAFIGYRRMLIQEKPDLVVLNTFFPNVIGRIVRRKGTRVVLMMHGGFWDNGVPVLVRFFWDLLERLLRGRADLILTNNPEDRDDMVRVGNAPERVRHIAGGLTGVNLDRFAPITLTAEERALRRQVLGLPDSILVGVFARMTPAKGILDLCKAANLLQEAGAHFVFCGPADGERGGDRVLAAIRKLGDRATYLGWVDDPEEVMMLCDIIVNPSHREGFGRVTAEAGALGLPVVATSTRGSRYLVDQGKTGLLVRVRCPAELTAAIRLLIHDPEMRRRMGEAGQKQSQSLFDAVSVCERLTAEFEMLLNPDSKQKAG